MAKSPLIKTLRLAYRVAQISRRGVPRLEVLDLLNEKVSRRRLLQGGLAVTAAFAATTFKREQPATAQSSIPPVLVVGAGIAGLTAAYRLKQAGVPVDVIEARSQVGGRIRSLPTAAGTQILADLGGEFIDSDHYRLQNLAAELGFEFKIVDLFAAAAGLVQDTYFLEGRKVPLSEIINDFAPIAERISADLEAIENVEGYESQLDTLSITEYLESILTTSTIREIINIAYTAEYGRDAEEQSCLNLIYFIGLETDEFNIFGVSDERFYLDGGNQQIPRKLAKLLGDAVETETVLESLKSLSDGRYRVALNSRGKATERTYERILLTVPFSVLRKIPLNVNLPPLKRLVIDTLGYGTNSKLITSYREKVWQTRYNSTASTFSDLGFQSTWETSQSRYTPGQGLITNYTGGRQGLVIGTATPEIHAQRLIPQLERVFPGISATRLQGKAVRAYWVNEQYTRGSYACYLVGQASQFFGVERERVGNLFFAGEHTSIDYQGYMEGGCETGEAAAAEILADLGLQVPDTARRRRGTRRRSRLRGKKFK